jgi:thiol-disulfide isomerase/thioredoxin
MMQAMKRRTVLLGVGGLAAMAVSGWAAWRASSRSAPAANRAVGPSSELARVGANPLALYGARLPGLDGQEFSLSTLKGRPLVVNFWATWCAPCVQEMPHLDSMAKELPEIMIVGIGIDTSQNIAQFVAKIPISYQLLIAGHAGIAMVRELGNSAGGLPFTLLFDANGSIFDSILGQVEPNDLRQRIDRLVTKSKT